MPKLISVDGDGHCCHTTSSNRETFFHDSLLTSEMFHLVLVGLLAFGNTLNTILSISCDRIFTGDESIILLC